MIPRGKPIIVKTNTQQTRLSMENIPLIKGITANNLGISDRVIYWIAKLWNYPNQTNFHLSQLKQWQKLKGSQKKKLVQQQSLVFTMVGYISTTRQLMLVGLKLYYYYYLLIIIQKRTNRARCLPWEFKKHKKRWELKQIV